MQNCIATVKRKAGDAEREDEGDIQRGRKRGSSEVRVLRKGQKNRE